MTGRALGRASSEWAVEPSFQVGGEEDGAASHVPRDKRVCESEEYGRQW